MSFKKYRIILVLLIFIMFYAIMISSISSSEKNYRNDVLVTAHRGSSIKAKDNSVEAIKLAIEEEADYIELDVRKTKDNKLVLSHDDIFIKSSGAAISISNNTLKEINYYKDIFNIKKEKVVTLEKALKMIKGKAKLNIDLKVNNDEQEICKLLVKLIEKYGVEKEVIVTSTDYNALINIKGLNNNIKTGYITKKVTNSFNIEDIDALSIAYEGLDREIVEIFHKNNKEVFVWTVNNEVDAERAIYLGVDNIITNDVIIIKKLIKKISSNSK